MGGIGHLKKSVDPLSKKNDIILELNDMSSHYILSIEAYSLLKEVCINGCGSTTSFLKDKEGWKGDIGFTPCVSVLQNGWATLGTFKNHLMLSKRKMISFWS